jgi:hypothetical protein
LRTKAANLKPDFRTLLLEDKLSVEKQICALQNRKKWVENVEYCLLIYPLPFSSLPKYLVHFSLRASRLNDKLLFLHLLESNHRIEPSFLTHIMPVPAGKSAPQNEHFLGFGMTNSPGYFNV